MNGVDIGGQLSTPLTSRASQLGRASLGVVGRWMAPRDARDAHLKRRCRPRIPQQGSNLVQKWPRMKGKIPKKSLKIPKHPIKIPLESLYFEVWENPVRIPQMTLIVNESHKDPSKQPKNQRIPQRSHVTPWINHENPSVTYKHGEITVISVKIP